MAGTSARWARWTFSATTALLACTRPPPPPEPPAAGGSAGVHAGEPRAAAADEAADAHADMPAEGGRAFVREPTALRRVPSDARFVDAKAKAKTANVVTLLQRGEAVQVQEAAPGYLKVRLSDGQVGYVRAAAIRVAPTLAVATTWSRQHCFSRPDYLAMDAARTIEPGALVFVLREKDGFAEVDVGTRATAWMLADVLQAEPSEVEAAKLYQRARAVALKDAERARPLFDLLRARFAGTQLVRRLLADEHAPPAEAAADGHEAAAPAPAPAPAQPAAPVPAGDGPAAAQPPAPPTVPPVSATGDDNAPGAGAAEGMPPAELDQLRDPLAPPPGEGG